jgi:hypothetical protein
MNLDNVDLAATLVLIVHRLVDAATAAINLANMFALMGAIFFVATLLMRTIVPLRIAASSAMYFSSRTACWPIRSTPSFCIACCSHQQCPPVPDDQTHKKGPGLRAR